ncbi:TPA: SDR family NAD(P)-dependent oxidoreductase [Pseudomonas aeruginosa]|uniref:3-hydroxyacyl-CoA dehydrogenase n=1 Tax=Pseudomonas plecoglossicida TaxID=70775 RepID=A0ABX4U3A2_PSEDL|nr:MULTISPECIES: SDR family NAD(P)-dependent oxidoreductase [Pseudomonas]ELB6583889.1 SDR family NAD(P)-dependent oxidoreductase [Pseudomonas aeruginosa]ELK4933851.1 SDR family NAD(P)-dependent oxidoreductase [Pseudomonas aeruginosa]MCL8372158.1 SDR family NAD(P)-dependent oxidoreductase [Pseudomonas aeruginosa]PLU87691.1 3-hydroxyacyl-CoA dehydrogenase [Pseudomonas plecoglossicida]PLU93185.1 3-hydroxyacyl-CoA dehydrogenase [Pseudomonas plecoglossicida]
MSASKLLDGKVALVTGGGRGIGRGIALALAEAGAKVVVNDLGVSLAGASEAENPAAEVVREIQAMGGSAVADHHSVADHQQAGKMVGTALQAFGRLDIVVNNAGNLRDCIFHRMSEEEFDAVIAVHLKGAFNVSRAAAPFFKEQGSGSFIHMTSTSGLIGNFGQVNYCAAKSAIVGLSKAIALDMQRFGVRSNAVAPFAWTRMVGSIPDETPEQKRRVEGLKKLIPEKIAPFVVALGSDAAKDVSGQIFGVRNNEIYLFSQPRPIRTAHTHEGWTPEQIVERVFPMFENDFYALHKSGDVFTWDPV